MKASTGTLLRDLLPPGVACGAFAELPVRGLALDSRSVTAGDLFLAVRGWKQDGRAFIADAVANGCAAVLAEAEDFEPFRSGQLRGAAIPLVLVNDLQSQVSAIAARFYGEPGAALDVVGVTGTNGKTTCTYLLAQLGLLLGYRPGLIGTLGRGVVAGTAPALADTGMTTPNAIELQATLADFRRRGVNLVAMEVSSHGLEQRRVDGAAIATAIFTNLSRDHLDYHGSEKRYAEAKTRLFRLTSVREAIVNVDDSLGAEIFAALEPTVTAVSFGLSDDAVVRAQEVVTSDSGIRFYISSPWGEGQVESRLLGEFNVFNLLAVISVFCLRGVALGEVLEGVKALTPVRGRMEMLARDNAPRVVVDYAHTPDALERALSALRPHCRRRLWCVFGCGGDRDQGKRPEMGAIAERLADRVILTSDNPRSEEPQAIIDQILVGMTELKNVRVETDRKTAIETAIGEASVDDYVLIAGKGHEDYQQVGDVKLPFCDRQVALDALASTGVRQ